MTQYAAPSGLEGRPAPTPVPSATVSRVGGGLALGHVVLLLGAFAFEGISAAQHGTSPAKLQQLYAHVSLPRSLGAGYLEAMSFVLLIPAGIAIAWLFSRRSIGGRIAGPTFAAFGVAYVATTLAVGFPPAAAAIYAAHHGVDPGSIAMVNDIRNYGYVLQIALGGGMALALGVAALAERRHTRWVGWGGVAVGTSGLVAAPFAHNPMALVLVIWMAGLGVVLLREKPLRD